MRITIIGYGTRGDVQPYLCLGYELAQRGHELKICAPENLRGMVERSGLAYAPLPIDIRALLSAPEAQEMLANGRSWTSVSRQRQSLPSAERACASLGQSAGTPNYAFYRARNLGTALVHVQNGRREEHA
jgi:UDP:flavonoid glycosyltransferase YjiC (YdhE family)